ncbi:MAG: homoserine kinase [Austwickia sp.]|jgi:homoserine kinase|nr:MAG: homoserine kinase [Austwickia sp.]
MVLASLPDGLAVAVTVPASSANLGPGFDSIGLALGVWDDYTVQVGGAGLRIDVVGEGSGQVPRDGRHLVYRCLARGLAAQGYALPAGLDLRCTNRVPHSRGLGSSATAAVAGFALANALVVAAGSAAPASATAEAAPGDDVPLDLAFVGELAAQAEGHPDNSSASVYGGLTVSWSDDVAAVAGVHTVRIEVHPGIEPIVLVPDIELSTAAARAALPTEVPLKSASLNAGRAALLVEAMTRRPDLLLAATRDWLHQEQRRIAYPATMRVVDRVRARGLAAVVSGAGPTVMLLVTREHAERARSIVAEIVALEDARWEIGAPGVPADGVRARRVGGTLPPQPPTR